MIQGLISKTIFLYMQVQDQGSLVDEKNQITQSTAFNFPFEYGFLDPQYGEGHITIWGMNSQILRACL